MQATHLNMTIRPFSPSSGVPASLSSILGKGFQDFLDGQVEKECRGQRGLMGTISLFSL